MLDGHVSELEYIRVRKHFEQLDLTQRSDGKSIAFIVHENLLESDDCAGAFRATF